MKGTVLLMLQTGVIAALLNAETKEGQKWDWRKGLLAEEGIEDTPEAMRKALEANALPEARMEDEFNALGSENFEEREKAQRALVRGGDPVFRWLEKKKSSADPEIRQRVKQILYLLGSDLGKPRENALEHALRSLLDEGVERRSDTGGKFFEWFGEDEDKLSNKYHACSFRTSSGRGGKVEDGRLVLSGAGGGDGDQSFVLKCTEWPGKERFADRFRISAKLGASPGVGGAWHIGISIGKVRALFHPDYRGGGFRFSKVGSVVPIAGGNVDMGFTPEGGAMYQMALEVTRIAGGEVVLDVTVQEAGGNSRKFEQKIVVKAETIGPLDQIALERSGRTGGDAWFSDFTVTLPKTD